MAGTTLSVLGRTLVTADVAQSFRVAPVSHVVQRWIPDATTFETWFSLPESEKELRRRQLDQLRPELGSSTRPNYEAHHPPLAYLPLALADWPLKGLPLTQRVLILRLVGGIAATLLVYFGARTLCRAFEMPDQWVNATLLTIFSSEMLYATIAHVANDWLAVGISVCFLGALRRSTLRTAAWLAAGLLTKAYFLPFVLLMRVRGKKALPGVLLVVALAGPWYARNIALYGNVSGTQEEFEGFGVRQALAAAPKIDWVATTGFLARSSLWTGNNSFTTFSRSTLNIVLALLFVALAAWMCHRKLVRPAEWVVGSAIVLFSIAVAYATCAAFAHTKGEVAGASPWYTQVLLAPTLALAYLGMSRWRRAGRAVAAATIAIWTWILIATWTIKLFPMYAGAGAVPMRVHELWNWYRNEAWSHAHDLSLTALAPAPLLYAGMMLSIILGILISAAVIRDIVTLNNNAT